MELAAQLYLETARSIQTALELGAEGGDLAEKAASYQQRAEQLRVSSAQAQLVSNVRGKDLYQLSVSSSLTLVSSPGCGRVESCQAAPDGGPPAGRGRGGGGGAGAVQAGRGGLPAGQAGRH